MKRKYSVIAYHWEFIDKIFPFGSKRRALFRYIYKIIRDPRIILDVTQLKKLFNFNEQSKRKNIQLPNFTEVSSVQRIEKIAFTKFLRPLVSIIIPVRNKWVYTYNCLVALAQNTHNVFFEVIVVDDASVDQTVKLLARIKNIKIIRNKKNEGFIKACNKGAMIADGKYLLFLNNDTLVIQGWLPTMVNLFNQYLKVGAVGAKLLFPNGTLQESGGIIWQDASGWNYGRDDDPDKWYYNYVKEVDYCSGSCLLVKKKIFHKLGGFDEFFCPAYGEDSDLCLKIRKHGYKVLYQPEAQIIHFEGITGGTDLSSRTKKFQEINQIKLRERWRNVLKKEHFEKGQHAFLARDRSRDKKIMLLIDHYVPTYDKDAGSLHIYEKIKMFLSMGFKIVFWSDDLQKKEPYVSKLQQRGVEVVYSDRRILFKKYIKSYGKYFHLIFMSRPYIAVKYIKTVKKYTNAKIIFFPHDLHFLRTFRKFELTKNKEDLKESISSKKNELGLINSSDATIVVSSSEKVILDKEYKTDKVFFIPFLYNPAVKRRKFVNDFSKRRDILFIGGFTHEPNEDCVLWFVEHIFPLIKRELSNIKFYIVGSNPSSKILQLKSSNIIVTGYVKNVTPLFLKTKVFICPLRFGAGVKGKILHSMSFGLPVVSTSIGAEGMDVKNGENIMIVDQPEEFAKQTLTLYTDEDLWLKLSKNSLRYIEENHSSEIVKEKYTALFYKLGIMP